LFPYTTLFRSGEDESAAVDEGAGADESDTALSLAAIEELVALVEPPATDSGEPIDPAIADAIVDILVAIPAIELEAPPPAGTSEAEPISADGSAAPWVDTDPLRHSGSPSHPESFRHPERSEESDRQANAAPPLD